MLSARTNHRCTGFLITIAATLNLLYAGSFNAYAGQRPRPLQPASSLPPSSIRELPDQKHEIARDLGDLAAVNEELQKASIAAPVDYVNVKLSVSDIQTLARRLIRRLFLGNSQSVTRAASSLTPPAQIAETLRGLNDAVRAVLSNSTIQNQTGAIQIESFDQNHAQLERIVQLSSELLEFPALKAVDKLPKSNPLHDRINRKITSVELGIQCDAWSVAKLVEPLSRVAGTNTLKIEDVKVQAISHKFARDQLIDVGDCVDAIAYEKVVAAQSKYVATIGSFVSYEVQGRIFAYRATYKIGLTKNGEIVKRYDLPVTFYFVDESGEGEFDVYDKPALSSFVPEWVMKLAASARKPKA